MLSLRTLLDGGKLASEIEPVIGTLSIPKVVDTELGSRTVVIRALEISSGLSPPLFFERELKF